MTGGDFGFFTGPGNVGSERVRRQDIAPDARGSRSVWRQWDDQLDGLLRWRRLGGWRLVLLGTAALTVTLFAWGLLATPQYGQTRLGNALAGSMGTLFTGGLIGGIGGFVHTRPSRSHQRVLRSASHETPGMHTCHYLGGAGLPFTSGVVYRLGLGHDHLRVALPTGQVVLDVPYGDVIEATAYGKGQVTTGGGVIGGGFGLHGAAEGMLIAAALNALSQKTTVESFIRLVTSTGEGVFALAESLPQRLDIELARLRVFKRSRPAQDTSSIVSGPSVPLLPESDSRVGSALAAPATSRMGPSERLTMLERLAQLRVAGVLSEQEFEAQKGLLLE